MDKIPVGQTIARTYSLVLKQFPSILGIIWLPFVVISAASLAVSTHLAAFSTALSERDFSMLAGEWQFALPYFLLLYLIVCVQIVGVTQHALGIRNGSPYFFFSLGAPVWRLAGAYLLVVLIFVAALAVLLIGVVLVRTLLAAITGATPSANTSIFLDVVGVVGVIGVYAAVFYGFLRQTFLLPSVIVAEQKIDLPRAWSLARGNFWQILAISAGILVPTALIQTLGSAALGVFPVSPSLSNGATPDQISAWNTAFYARQQHYWFVIYPFFLLTTVAIYGAFCSAQTFAYRSLVPAEKVEDVF
jgi:hypothetical protein